MCDPSPGEQHEIVTLNATSECVCDCTVDDRECDENMLCKNNKSGCETDKGSVSTKERALLVEKEGCATVVMYPERHTAHVFLADGTVITGNIQGDYQVRGLCQIRSHKVKHESNLAECLLIDSLRQNHRLKTHLHICLLTCMVFKIIFTVFVCSCIQGVPF